jgi:hypothetical protein
MRSANTRCSYSGIGLWPPDSCSGLKRSSAFFLEVMKISFALKLRNACRVMWSWCTPTARGKNCSEEEAPFAFESDGSPRRALCRFHRLWFKAPELKAVSADGLFDRISGKIVRRSVPGCDRTNLSPGTKLIGQLASRRVSCKRSQTGIFIRFEDKESHRITSLRSV